MEEMRGALYKLMFITGDCHFLQTGKRTVAPAASCFVRVGRYMQHPLADALSPHEQAKLPLAKRFTVDDVASPEAVHAGDLLMYGWGENGRLGLYTNEAAAWSTKP